MPLIDILRKSPHQHAKPKILLLGSGGLSIGQAGEFDYSGTQAVKAILEEGIDVVIINPNIATVQTNPQPGAKVYLYPVEPSWVEKIIAAEKPDAIMASFGGQTALNCLLALDEQGILKKYNVENIGTSVETLRLSEDRDHFAACMRRIGMPVPPSAACDTLEKALKAANSIGYPVIVRAAYALGGLGSGFANNDQELKDLVHPALVTSPQVLVEKSLKGWKEIEYEVMRDREGNTITICNMENFDPLGVHTGDSIVVCPSQSLSDDEYQLLRNSSIKIINELKVVGECNCQLALDPVSENFYVIEVNARLSRSSALASKASGYPIAYIAAKVVLGYDLLEIKNPVTGVTIAFTEPALDYITVKVPRWDLVKFQGASRNLGSTMKSVGEIMSIGRNFPEALQKAVRMVTENGIGLSEIRPALTQTKIKEILRFPTDTRLYAVLEGLRQGLSVEAIHQESDIDKWFLSQLKLIIDQEAMIRRLREEVDASLDEDTLVTQALAETSTEQMRLWKTLGFGDEQIAALLLRKDREPLSDKQVLLSSLKVREKRQKQGIVPVVKKIDTTAAEYPSPSNYLYMSYGGKTHDPIQFGAEKAAIVLGCGAYRVGTSVEFDWCAVSASRTLQKNGWKSIIINCNPETVSTDYNSSDALYFEELSLERILDIIELEKPKGVIASMGGQLPNKLSLQLHECGVSLLGHAAGAIDAAENRSRFSAILDSLDIAQPRWMAAASLSEMQKFIDEVGFPVLVRPSYVLSGAAMKVAYDRKSLDEALQTAVAISSDFPVVVSEFIEGAREIEVDGVARQGEILTSVVSEHVENAGVHSGDATTLVPGQKLYVETVRRVRRAARQIAAALNLNGPFNIQFLARSNHILVIECNARAARSFPFVSKIIRMDLARAATEIMIGKEPVLKRLEEDNLPHVGVKAAMFSFTRLAGVDPVLGVEMASTGEVGCIGRDMDAALLLALQATHNRLPKKGLLVSAGPEMQKLQFLKSAEILASMQIPIYATTGTAKYLRDHGYTVTAVPWPGRKQGNEPDVLDIIRNGTVDFVLNIPKNMQAQELTDGARIRQTAVSFNCSLFTNMEKFTAFMQAMQNHPNFLQEHTVEALPDFLS